MIRRFLLCAIGGVLAAAASAQAQLRIVDYNAAGGPRSGFETILAALGAESVNGVSKAPDVFALQELTSAETTQAIVDLLNQIYGAGTYARATVQGGTTGAGRPGLIYNTTTVELIATTTASTLSNAGAARQTMRYELRPAGYDAAADFYVYVSHYKASTGGSNEARRNVEAQQVRANADALGEGAHIIYAGDFNIYGSSEAMWGTLTASGAGQAFDPVNRVGAWSNNAAFKDVHTQSPATVAAYGGQVTGGMDDRFDYQLVSGEFLDNEGLAYMAGSYHAFGNTGTHTFNGAITTGSAMALQALLPGYTEAQASAVLQALASASDHLPVVAQYQIPAKMSVAVGGVPTRVIVGAAAGVEVTVANVAPVLIAAGADELDYVVTGAGDLAGQFEGADEALGGADTVSLPMAADSVGAKTGTISVVSASQAAANATFEQTLSYEVVDHANPLFADAPGATFSMDLGSVTQFAAPLEWTLSIVNGASDLGATAALDLDAISSSGDAAFTTDLSLFQGLAAGGVVNFRVLLATDVAGMFTTTFTFSFSDEDLPGAQSLGSLDMNVSGAVVPVPEPAVMVLLACAAGAFALLRRPRLV